MRDDEGTVSSVDQDEWLEIVRGIRSQLAKRLPDLASMSAGDVKLFVEAVTDARWLNERALCMDESVAREMNKLPYDRD